MATDNGGAENHDGDPAEVDDVKRKFREALERKNHRTTAAVEHKDGRSKVGNAHGPVGGKRDFRRKSG